jgi:hypothetical protein
MSCRRKSSVYGMKSVNLRKVIVLKYGQSDVCCRYASLYISRKFGKLKAKKLTIPNMIPKNRDKRMLHKTSRVFKTDTLPECETAGRQPSLFTRHTKKGIITFFYLHIQ